MRLNTPEFEVLCDAQVGGRAFFNSSVAIYEVDIRSNTPINISPIWPNQMAKASFHDLTTGYVYFIDPVANQFVRVHKDAVAAGLAYYGAVHPELTAAAVHGAYDPKTGLFYFGDGFNVEYTYDPVNDIVTPAPLIQATGVVSSIAFDNAGIMWGYDSAAGNFLRINKATGAINYSTPSPFVMDGLTFDTVFFATNADGITSFSLPDLSDAALILNANLGTAIGSIEVADITLSKQSFVRRYHVGQCAAPAEVCDFTMIGTPYTVVGIVGTCSEEVDLTGYDTTPLVFTGYLPEAGGSHFAQLAPNPSADLPASGSPTNYVTLCQFTINDPGFYKLWYSVQGRLLGNVYAKAAIRDDTAGAILEETYSVFDGYGTNSGVQGQAMTYADVPVGGKTFSLIAFNTSTITGGTISDGYPFGATNMRAQRLN